MDDENFFANIGREGESINDFSNDENNEQANDEPAESQTENAEERVPYHKDPRWIQQRRELEEERAARQETEGRYQQMQQELDSLKGDSVDQPEFLTDLVGENEQVARNFKKYESQLEQRIIERLAREQGESQQREQQEAQKWEKWAQDNISQLQEDTGFKIMGDDGITTEGQEFLDMMQQYPIQNQDGTLDFKRSFDLYQKINEPKAAIAQQKSTARKEIADKTVTRDNSGRSNADYATPDSLRGSWQSLIK